MKINNAIQDYLAYAKHEQGLTPATLKTYAANLRVFVRWASEHKNEACTEIHIDVLTTTILRKYLQARGGLRP